MIPAVAQWASINSISTIPFTYWNQPSGELHRFAIRPRLSTDSLYALRNAALAGLGAGIASAWVVSEDLAAGRLIHLTPQWQAAPLPVFLVYPHARFYPAKLRVFIELMRATVPTLVGMTGAGGSLAAGAAGPGKPR